MNRISIILTAIILITAMGANAQMEEQLLSITDPLHFNITYAAAYVQIKTVPGFTK
jgi:hypothetical protein